MKKKVSGLFCFLLIAILMFSTLFTVASAEESAVYGNTTDFVLLLDCSATMKENDPKHLCQDACKMFMNLIPEENARVAISF